MREIGVPVGYNEQRVCLVRGADESLAIKGRFNG